MAKYVVILREIDTWSVEIRAANEQEAVEVATAFVTDDYEGAALVSQEMTSRRLEVVEVHSPTA
jgi:hypothetical protein